MIFCMTSEVSGNHILTNSRNTSWRYLKTPFLFIPSQNGWWSCPSKLEVIQVFPIFFFNFKDLIILSVCSDVFLYLSLSLYIYIYILVVFLNKWRRKLQKSLQRVNNRGCRCLRYLHRHGVAVPLGRWQFFFWWGVWRKVTSSKRSRYVI